MPFMGHINPALPLTTELVNRGHEVVWYTAESYCAKAEFTGAIFANMNKPPSFKGIPVVPDEEEIGLSAGISVMRKLFVDSVCGKNIILIYKEREALGLRPLTKDIGFQDIVRLPYLHLMLTTLAVEYPRGNFDSQIHSVGPLIPVQGATFVPPVWWPGHRVVHFTQSTFATNEANLIRPQSTRAELLPHISVMITNAGYNGMLTALAHGVPLICAERSEDKAEVNAEVGWSGAGIDLQTDTPSEMQILKAVGAVLRSIEIRENAKGFALHRGVVEACDLLEKLAKQRDVVSRRD